MGRVSRKRSVAFLISDFQDEGFGREIRLVSRKHELIGVLLSDPGEFRLPEAGILTLRDPETRRMVLLDAADRRTRSAWEALLASAYQERVALLKSHDVDVIELRTGDSAADALTRYFRYRERRKR